MREGVREYVAVPVAQETIISKGKEARFPVFPQMPLLHEKTFLHNARLKLLNVEREREGGEGECVRFQIQKFRQNEKLHGIIKEVKSKKKEERMKYSTPMESMRVEDDDAQLLANSSTLLSLSLFSLLSSLFSLLSSLFSLLSSLFSLLSSLFSLTRTIFSHQPYFLELNFISWKYIHPDFVVVEGRKTQ